MKQLLLFFVLLISLFSCDQENKKLTALSQETDRIHDEAMKDLAEMQRVKRGVQEFLIAATLMPEQSKIYADVLLQMEKADADMSDWMANYQSPEGMDEQSALLLVEAQHQGIAKNQQDIRSATQAGKKLLLPPNQ